MGAGNSVTSRMSLQSSQTLLARLYTDAKFRREFMKDPEGIAVEMGLDKIAGRELAQTTWSEIEEFSRSLHFKRISDLQKVFPQTAGTLGPRFGDLFFQFVGGGHAANDTLAFGRFLENELIKESKNAGYYEWVRHENAWLMMRQGKRRWIVRKFRNDRPILCIWLRVSRTGPIRHFVFPFRNTI